MMVLVMVVLVMVVMTMVVIVVMIMVRRRRRRTTIFMKILAVKSEGRRACSNIGNHLRIRPWRTCCYD